MRQKLILASDVRFTLLWVLSAVTVRCLPQGWWSNVARLTVRARPSARRLKQFGDVLQAAVGEAVAGDVIAGFFQDHRVNRHRARMINAAERRRGGWRTEIELIGREKLDDAIAGGRGAILWFDTFGLAPIVGKRAFAEAGYRMWHLSGHAHGSSNSRFARRYLNHRVIDAELRYLAGRIVIGERSTVPATRRIVEVLDHNGIVSITNAPYFGTRTTTRLGNALLPISRTPLNLAAGRGAALLPVSVIEVEPFARYRVVIGDAIRPPGAEVSDPIAAMAGAYAAYLLPLAKAHRDQWSWFNLRLPNEPG